MSSDETSTVVEPAAPDMGVDFGRVGLWTVASSWPERENDVVAAARRIEATGLGTVWLGFSGPDTRQFELATVILAATSNLTVATGVIEIWSNDVRAVGLATRQLNRDHPRRFCLGLGVGHAPSVESVPGQLYQKPYTKMVKYLDELDEFVPPEQRLLAALGPKMLELARTRAAGAHPYNGTPAHTAQAREALGPTAILAPGQRVTVCADGPAGREIARRAMVVPLSLENYRNLWRRIGFTDRDFEDGGSDRFIDTVVSWGSPSVTTQRVADHLEAGANHVAMVVIDTAGAGGLPFNEIEAAAAAGLGSAGSDVTTA